MKGKYKVIISALIIATMGITITACGSKSKNTSNQDNKQAVSADSNKAVDNKEAASSKETADKNEASKDKAGSKDTVSTGKEGDGGTSNKSGAMQPRIKKDTKDLKGSKIGIFSQEANVGSVVKVIVDNKQIDKNKAVSFGVFSKGKPVSKVVGINEETTMYPNGEIGSKVQIKLYDKNKSETYSFDAVLQSGE